MLPMGLLRYHALIFTKGFNVDLAGVLAFKSLRLKKEDKIQSCMYSA